MYILKDMDALGIWDELSLSEHIIMALEALTVKVYQPKALFI